MGDARVRFGPGAQLRHQLGMVEVGVAEHRRPCVGVEVIDDPGRCPGS